MKPLVHPYQRVVSLDGNMDGELRIRAIRRSGNETRNVLEQRDHHLSMLNPHSHSHSALSSNGSFSSIRSPSCSL